MSSALEEEFALMLKAAGIPFLREFRFAPPRRWRFDFFLATKAVAIELEGGVFVQGRHNRGKGMLDDMDKYNAAAEKGIFVLRFGRRQVKDGTALELVERIIKL